MNYFFKVGFFKKKMYTQNPQIQQEKIITI